MSEVTNKEQWMEKHYWLYDGNDHENMEQAFDTAFELGYMKCKQDLVKRRKQDEQVQDTIDRSGPYANPID